MSPRARRAGTAAALGVVVATLSVTLALGHEKTYKLKPKPTIAYANEDRVRGEDPIDYFSGDLVYKKQPLGGKHCLGDRTVKVFRESPLVVIGEAQTQSDGTWKLEAEDVAGGEYRARVVKKFAKVTFPPGPGIGGHIHKFRCLHALSAKLQVSP
jgi:hypothetical protein